MCGFIATLYSNEFLHSTSHSRDAKYLRSRSGTYFSGFTRLTAQFKARSTEKLNGLLQLDPHRRASSVPELETLQLWKLTRCESRKNWSWKSRLCSGTSTRNTKRSLCQLPSSSPSPEIQLRTLQWTWPGPDLHQQQVSVNPALEVEKFPLPKPEEVFATLASSSH